MNLNGIPFEAILIVSGAYVPYAPNGLLILALTRVVFTQAAFTNPLFPNLRSLCWRDFTILTIVHAIVPSLTSLFLDFGSFREGKPPLMDFLDIVGERCRYMGDFSVHWSATGPLDATISRQVCPWTNL